MKKVAILVPSFRPINFFETLLPNLRGQIGSLVSLGNLEFKIFVLIPYSIELDDFSLSLSASDLIILRTHERGFSIPRNILWNASKDHDLNVFIDDDQVPEQDWLRNLIGNFSSFKTYSVFVGNIRHVIASPVSNIKLSKLLPKPRIGQGIEISNPRLAIGNCAFNRASIGELESPFSLEFNEGGEDIYFMSYLRNLGHRFSESTDVNVLEIWDESRLESKILNARNARGVTAFYKLRLHAIKHNWEWESDFIKVYGRFFLLLLLAPILLVIFSVNYLNPFKIQKIRLSIFLAKIYFVSTIPWKIKFLESFGRSENDIC